MGGYVLTRLATERAEVFGHLILIDPVIMAPGLYAGQVGQPIPDPAEHPVSRRRNQWASVDEMRARFAGSCALQPLGTRGTGRLLHLRPAARFVGRGAGARLSAGARSLDVSECIADQSYAWLGDLNTPVTLIRAPQGLRGDTMDFSQSPTWTGLGPAIGAAQDELWNDHSHFIPMEAPARVAALIAAAL
jgi:lipase